MTEFDKWLAKVTHNTIKGYVLSVLDRRIELNEALESMCMVFEDTWMILEGPIRTRFVNQVKKSIPPEYWVEINRYMSNMHLEYKCVYGDSAKE